MKARTTIAAWLCAVPLAFASPVTIEVKTPDGAPVPNAVVSVANGERLAAGFKFPGPASVTQRDLKFEPSVVVVAPGTNVAFPNFDTVSHHVYSFSPAKTFELKLYGKDETRTVNFPSPGIVAIGCNIHDSMTAHIYVADTPLTAMTDAQGRAVIDGAPDGALELLVWHASSGAPGQRLPVPVAAEARKNPVVAVLALRSPRRQSHSY